MGFSVARSRLLAVAAVLSAGGIASFAAGWRAPPTAELSPSDVVAMRFAETWDEPDASASADPADLELADEQRLVLFSPHPTFPQPIRQSLSLALAPVPALQQRPAAPDDVRTPAAPVVTPAEPTEAKPLPAKPEPQPAQVRVKPPAVRPPPARSPNVLNDAQIASIKERLNLSPDQEHMWPSVEAALRKLVYAKVPGAPRTQASHTIDPNSTELQGLKSAAIPLVMSFDDGQKRELRTLVQVMGLEKLASQF